MKRKNCFILLFTIVGIVEVFAEGNDDSLKTYQMKDVVVTGTRSRIERSYSPVRVYTLTKRELETVSGKTLGEVLSGKPGVFIRQYGVGGSLQIASFRGMGVEHSVILLDGLPIDNVQTGLSDLRMLSMDGVEEIELVRGGSSSLYGSDALGGVINIVSVNPDTLSAVQSEGSVGSFGAQRFSISAQFPLAREVAFTAGVSTENGKGDFPFRIDESGIQRDAIRQNSDYHSRSMFVKARWNSSLLTRSSLFVSSLVIDRGTPGPVLSIANQGHARQSDEQLQIVGSRQTVLTDRLQWMLAGNFQNTYERYVDALGLFPADNYYRNISMNVFSEIGFVMSPSSVLRSGVEVGEAQANGNALVEKKSRTHFGTFINAELHEQFSDNDLRFSVYPSLRYDSYGSFGNAFSPKIGLNMHQQIGESRMTVHASLSKDFRVPTFNELYYAGAGGLGNPTLGPERSVSMDGGITFFLIVFGALEFDATYYLIDTDDRIVWLPTSTVSIWSPKNIGRTRSSGVEAEVRWSLVPEYLEIECNYSYMDAKKQYSSGPNDPTYDKQLIYIPLETGSLAVRSTIPVDRRIISGIFFGVSERYTGIRYASEDNLSSLSPYFDVSADIGIEVQVLGARVRTRYDIQNVLDEVFEVVPRYPMPLRNSTLTISIHKSY